MPWILSAFDRARRSGKADWKSMTLAVLKNRLMSETGGSFDERVFGARNIAEFVRAFPEYLHVDFDRPYPLVTLLDVARSEGGAPRSAMTERVRADLWRATFDYQSGRIYVFDVARGIAVAAADGTTGPQLPTLTQAELDAWRQAFADTVRTDLSAPEVEELERWHRDRLPTQALPRSLRSLWNRTMTTRAIERLQDWFRTQALTLPQDLILQPAAAESSEAEELRRFVQSCVARMTPTELQSLRLPAAAAARVSSPQRSS